MPKDYFLWSRFKSILNNKSSLEHINLKPGQIWWCSLGVNIDIESDGKSADFARPVWVEFPMMI
jgi:hypothetical protein